MLSVTATLQLAQALIFFGLPRLPLFLPVIARDARLRSAAAGYLQITYNSTGIAFPCNIDEIRALFYPALDRL